MIESFQHLFKKRFESVEDHELLAQCTLLDRRIKKYAFLSESKYRNTVQALYGKISNINIPEVVPETPSAQSSAVTRESGQRRESILWNDFNEEGKRHQTPRNET